MIKGNNIKFYHFQTKEIFESELEKGNITPDSLVFIKDESLIWTHNNYYGDLSELFDIIESNERIIANALIDLNENKADKISLDEYVKNEKLSELYKILEDKELVVASSLVDLSENKADKSSLEEYAKLESLSELQQIVEDNELIAATAITDLNDVKADKINAITPIFSDPELDFNASGNNVNCYGYVGTLENLGISEGTLLIDSIGVYVREGSASPNSGEKVWCRLLKKESDSWKVIAQSEEPQSIGDFDQESLFTFKIKNIGPDSIIKTSEKIAITYVNAVDALPNSGIQLGFKSVSKPGGLQSALVETSSGNSSWCPAFVFGYIPLSTDLDEFVHKTGDETISGIKTFNSLAKFTNSVSISGKSTITSSINPGELKVFHDNTTKGFIIRTRNNSESIFPLELLSTNNTSSYQYNFPTTSGNVAIGVGIGDKVYNTRLDSGLIDLGGDLILKAKEVSYSELKLMCDEKRLLPGQFYRIIDYITESADVETISEKKPFDLIVKAIDVDKLSEEVNACAPTEDRSYYGSSQVGLFPITSTSISPLDWNEVTEISETISNSIVDYESTNNISFGRYKVVEGEFTVNVTGGSVKVVIAPRNISKAISCCGVEVFDGDQIVSSTYKIKTINSSGGSINYFLTGLESNKTYKVKLKFIKIEEPGSINLFLEINDYSNPYYIGIDFSKWVLKYNINNDTEKYSWADTENGKGVIYYLKDEWNNECSYDFKNIKFKRTQEWRSSYPALSSNSEYNFSEAEKYFYTFDYNGSDDSLNKGRYKCENNSIGKCMSGKQIQLNNTIFFGNGNSNNKLGENNKNNVFGYDTYNNIIGVNCQNNVFCQKFTYNEIKNGFKNNYCSGNYFRYNEVNHLFEGNTFKGYVTRCKFSSEFKNNTLSGLVYDSTFGNNIQNCIFNGIIGHSNLGNVLLNITNFPELYKVTISPNTLSSVDLTTVNDSVSGKPLSEALLNKLSSGSYSEESICLYKKPNTSGSYEYCINKQSISTVAISGSYNDLTDKPDSIKNPNSLSFGSKSYDGSSPITLLASDLGLSSALKYCGITTTMLSDGSTTNPITINGSSHTAEAGCVVFYNDKEFIFNGSQWEELGYSVDLSSYATTVWVENNYKLKQDAISSPTASGTATAFIDTISQDTQGKITVTKKNIDLSSYARTSELDDIYKVIEDNELTVAEGLTNLSNNKLDKSYLSSLSTNTHTHNFTGTSGTIQKTTTDSVSVATGSHTHTITPSGTVSSTFTGTSVTSNKSSATEEVANQSHTHTVIPLGNVTSTFSNNFGTDTGLQNIEVGSSSHQHTVTAEGSVSSTFTGDSSETGNSGPTVSYSNGTLTITLGHSHSYTPSGNISSSFTGTEVYSSIPNDNVSLNHSHEITGSGSVSSSFSGVSSNVLATTATGIEVSSKDHTHTVTAEGTISSSFSGTSSSTSSISGTVGVASQDHTHSYTPSGTISSAVN